MGLEETCRRKFQEDRLDGTWQGKGGAWIWDCP